MNQFFFLRAAAGKNIAMYRLSDGGIGVLMFKTAVEAEQFAIDLLSGEHIVSEYDSSSAYACLVKAKEDGATHVISGGDHPDRFARAAIDPILLALDLSRT